MYNAVTIIPEGAPIPGPRRPGVLIYMFSGVYVDGDNLVFLKNNFNNNAGIGSEADSVQFRMSFHFFAIQNFMKRINP